jgi:phosphohistidine phosphatase
MRRLLIFRHSKAERALPGASDHERVLIDRGRKDAAKIGAYMASHGLVPDLVLFSTSARTEETWKFAAGAFKHKPPAQAERKLYDATPRAIMDVIKLAPADAHTLMIVGHNPGLHEVALLLIASGDIDAREALREKFPTSGLVIIDFAFDDWRKLHAQGGRLERFVSPKSLETGTA